MESDSNSVEFDEKSLIILDDETVSSDLDHSDLAFIDESERSIIVIDEDRLNFERYQLNHIIDLTLLILANKCMQFKSKF